MENPEIIIEPVVETVIDITPEQKIKNLEAQLELLKQLQPIIESLPEIHVEQIVDPIIEPIVESLPEIPVEQVVEQVVDPIIPKVIQNSDFLYKSNIQWADNIEYVEPNAYEIEMLRGTKKADQIIEEEQEEEIVIKSQEEIKKQRTKDLLLIFKVVSLNRLGYHPIKNTSTLQPVQLKEFLDMMNSIITNEFEQGLEIKIRDEFNKICNEKLFSSNCDISQYPVYA